MRGSRAPARILYNTTVSMEEKYYCSAIDLAGSFDARLEHMTFLVALIILMWIIFPRT